MLNCVTCDMPAPPCDECIVCEAVPMPDPDTDIPLHYSIYLLKCDEDHNGDNRPKDGV